MCERFKYGDKIRIPKVKTYGQSIENFPFFTRGAKRLGVKHLYFSRYMYGVYGLCCVISAKKNCDGSELSGWFKESDLEFYTENKSGW